MHNKTLTELRALARAAGLRGYSALAKKELIQALAKSASRQTTPVSAAHARTKPKSAVKKKPLKKTANRAAGTRTKSGASVAFVARPVGEQQIESAKFETTLRGSAWVPPPANGELNENIDALPALNEPVLCLLPQKPGVLHAYWVLAPGTNLKPLRLRLCLIMPEAIEILEEIQISSERGHWYFHVPEQVDAETLLAQIGYRDGTNFITAIRRGIARIPGLAASRRTDRSWWVSDEEFREMYLRAGGVIRGRTLSWPGTSPSSPTK